MTPLLLAINDGLIADDGVNWRPTGQLVVSIFAQRNSDERIAQFATFEVDLTQFEEGGANALVRDWDEQVESILCYPTHTEVPSPWFLPVCAARFKPALAPGRRQCQMGRH